MSVGCACVFLLELWLQRCGIILEAAIGGFMAENAPQRNQVRLLVAQKTQRDWWTIDHGLHTSVFPLIVRAGWSLRAKCVWIFSGLVVLVYMIDGDYLVVSFESPLIFGAVGSPFLALSVTGVIIWCLVGGLL